VQQRDQVEHLVVGVDHAGRTDQDHPGGDEQRAADERRHGPERRHPLRSHDGERADGADQPEHGQQDGVDDERPLRDAGAEQHAEGAGGHREDPAGALGPLGVVLPGEHGETGRQHLRSVPPRRQRVDGRSRRQSGIPGRPSRLTAFFSAR
jgi:hypothetical protein